MGESAAGRAWLRAQVLRLRPKLAQRAVGTGAPVVPKVAVVTDSAAALPAAWLEEFSRNSLLGVVAMPVIIGGNVFAEDDAELESHISLALASGTAVSTSRPSPGQFDSAYKAAAAAGYEAVVSVHISCKLSGTHGAAQVAAARAPLPVHVLDTGTVGMGQGRAVQAAVASAACGGDVAEVLAAAGAAAGSSSIYFYVPSLEQLRKGGRISMASSWLGTFLDLKPLLGIRGGAVVPLEKIRTAPKAIARLQELALLDIAGRGAAATQVSIHHFGNEPQAKELGLALQREAPGLSEATLTRLPAVLAAHAGLGVLVVVVAEALVPPGTDPPQEQLPAPQVRPSRQALPQQRGLPPQQALPPQPGAMP